MTTAELIREMLKLHSGDAKMPFEKEDKLEVLNKRLQEVATKFNELKKSGIDEEILIAFIHDRTKLSKGSIRLFLSSQDEFYQRLTSKMFLEALGEETQKLAVFM